MVVRSGGVEGKFVQDVYPYLYLVRDTGLAAAAGTCSAGVTFAACAAA